MLTCKIHDVSFDDGDNCPQCEALVEAQVEGLELVEAAPKAPRTATPEFMREFSQKLSGAVNYVSGEGLSGTPDFIIGDFLAASYIAYAQAVTRLGEYRKSDDTEVSETFGFYLDGYTLSPTNKIGEVTVTRYDGKSAVLKSKSLTDYFDRRIDPHNEGED